VVFEDLQRRTNMQWLRLLPWHQSARPSILDLPYWDSHRDILPSAWRTTAADAMDPICHIQSRSWPMISTCHPSYNMARFTSQYFKLVDL
jgi:hypothetical protein